MLICTACQPPPPAGDTPWRDPTQQMQLLESDDFRIRALAAFNLGNIGAAEAIPALEKHQADPHPKVRAAVETALQKLRQPAK